MADGWYVMRNDQRYGPYSSTQLVEMAQKGQVLPLDWVARADAGQWIPASQVKGLFAASTQAAVPPRVRDSAASTPANPFAFGPHADPGAAPAKRKARPMSARFSKPILAAILGGALLVILVVVYFSTRHSVGKNSGSVSSDLSTKGSDRQSKERAMNEREVKGRSGRGFDKSKRFSVAEHHNVFGGDKHYTKTLISQEPWIDLHCWQVGPDTFACLTTFTDLDVKPWIAYEVKRYDAMTRKQMDELKLQLKQQYRSSSGGSSGGNNMKERKVTERTKKSRTNLKSFVGSALGKVFENVGRADEQWGPTLEVPYIHMYTWDRGDGTFDAVVARRPSNSTIFTIERVHEGISQAEVERTWKKIQSGK